MLVRAVAFDVDGTLYSNRAFYIRTLRYAAGRIRFLRSFAHIRKKIRTLYPIEDFHATQAGLLAEAMGTSHDAARTRIQKWFDVELDSVFRRLAPFPHLSDCIRQFRSAGLKLGILTDSPLGKKLNYLGLEDQWDCVVSSEEVGYLKPRPEPFRKLIECLDEPADRIVYIGNNFAYDILGAANAGLKTAYLTRRPADVDTADIAFSDYRRLAPEVFELGRS